MAAQDDVWKAVGQVAFADAWAGCYTSRAQLVAAWDVWSAWEVISGCKLGIKTDTIDGAKVGIKTAVTGVRWVGGHATVAESDAVGKECRVILRQLGESLVRSVQGARGVARWGVARPPEGWQVSLGGMRPGHIDPSHLGHLILTVTLEGDCVIGVQRQRGEPAPPGDGRWDKQVQRQFDYYAIWGDSIEPHKIKHRVDAGHQQRLSITMRFVNSIPLAMPEEEDGDLRWRVGDACSAFWQQEAWYLGQILSLIHI